MAIPQAVRSWLIIGFVAICVVTLGAATTVFGVKLYIANNQLETTQLEFSQTKDLLLSARRELASTQGELATKTNELSAVAPQSQSLQQQLTATKEELSASREQLQSTLQQLATTKAQLDSATSRINEMTAGANPVILTSVAQVLCTSLVGCADTEMVVTATVANRGAPGIVRVSVTATWSGGSRTGTMEAYIPQGDVRPVVVTLASVPTTATYTVSAVAK